MKRDPSGFSALGMPLSLGGSAPSPPPSSMDSSYSRGGTPGFLSQSSAFLKSESDSYQYPPNHPLATSKHLCAICGDRASGKHYGVHSCEGCKGFFKRTVRKELTYTCREEQNCIVDKRQRNRCQYCRYRKCLHMGMRREAVQEERQRTRERDGGDGDADSVGGGDNGAGTNGGYEMPVGKILEAEHCADYLDDQRADSKDAMVNLSHSADRQFLQLVEWAKRVPHFMELPIDDQVCLLRAGWNELLIAAFSHRSMNVKNGILLASGLLVERQSAHGAGVGAIFDRVLSELVTKMREMKIDKTELGCLRAIVLFNSGVKGLSSTQKVELLREQVFISLEDYCRKVYTHEPGRFAKLLLRLPSLRSIGLKCLEHLFFYKLIGDAPLDTVLQDMLEAPPIDY